MDLTLVHVLFIFIISFFLSFIKIDIIPISSIIIGLEFNYIIGMILGIVSKLLSGLLRKRIDHRTYIHIGGIILFVSIGTLLPFSFNLYPIVLLFIYMIITFPIIQYFGGDVFRGILFNIKDLIASTLFLYLLQGVF